MSLSLKDIAAHGHVRRWHTARVRREQTLGEHVGLVAMIALELHIKATRIAVGMDAARAIQNYRGVVSDSAYLLTACLHHDAPEIQFGDTPAPAKTFFRDHLQIHIDQMTEQTFWNERGGPSTLSSLGPDLTEIFRHADLLEAWLFYRQEGLDAHKMAAIQADLDAAHERLSPALKAASLAMVDRYLAEVG